MNQKRVAILISGRGSNMQALVHASQEATSPFCAPLVISNKEDAPGLAWARAQGIQTETVSHKDFPQKQDFERQIHRVLQTHHIDLVCLAGFMRILSPAFVMLWENRILNVHPSLLPAFPGLDTHNKALEAGVKVHGCSVHFVTANLDAGPIIAQAVIAVREDDTPESLAQRILPYEHQIYPFALRKLAQGSIKVEGNRTFISDHQDKAAGAFFNGKIPV